MTTTTPTGNLTLDDAVTSINKARLANKGQWFQWSGTVNGTAIQIKAYGTWVQIFQCPRFKDGSPSELTAGGFKTYLRETLAKAVN